MLASDIFSRYHRYVHLGYVVPDREGGERERGRRGEEAERGRVGGARRHSLLATSSLGYLEILAYSIYSYVHVNGGLRLNSIT